MKCKTVFVDQQFLDLCVNVWRSLVVSAADDVFMINRFLHLPGGCQNDDKKVRFFPPSSNWAAMQKNQESG